MPPGHCLSALEMLTVEIYNFLIEVPFTKKKMPWCPCPFKNEAYMPAYDILLRLVSITGKHNFFMLSYFWAWLSHAGVGSNPDHDTLYP